MANPELGAKQICPSCSAKFYDLGKRPAVCPKCGTEFDPEEALRSRRVRARSVTPDYEAEEEKENKVVDTDGFEDEADETPEIDEAAEADAGDAGDDDGDADPGAPASGDDLGVDFAEEDGLEEDSEDVPFLEDEDEDEFGGEDIEGLPNADDEER
ncbi:TIGR02300 family protein [Caulobacter sp. CCUG 60055]|uniref:TIGR02300 family protein n=1 Tax=Caulobacter sp. CCUG 60055 TaxID=2100090 RepID=UPI001FA6EB68|nr:TIGR02300 family protein [Caulobacter sp. CCUG 60055]MBQ1543631.1 TIGR02300 family protein [Caulobacteraceae bacterium]MCI3181529.1 TIGR02300 family protein [Caulobacter sp. CCUG 60055]